MGKIECYRVDYEVKRYCVFVDMLFRTFDKSRIRGLLVGLSYQKNKGLNSVLHFDNYFL